MKNMLTKKLKKIVITGAVAASVAVPVVSMVAPSPVYALSKADQKQLKNKFVSNMDLYRISQDKKKNTSKWRKYVTANTSGYKGGRKYVRAYISFNGKPKYDSKCQDDSFRKYSYGDLPKPVKAEVFKSGIATTTKNAMNKKFGTAYAKYGWD